MKISVITATFNSAATIAECVDSIAAQDHGDVEHVVVDGQSTDGTLEVLDERRDSIAQLVSEPDEGIYDALNKGIGLATGDVVGFLHADDVLADSSVLSWVADAFEDDDVDGVYGDLQYVSATDTSRVIRHWRSGEFSPRKLRWGWMPPHPTLYVRREWYQWLGGLDTGYRIAADYHSILRLLSEPGFKVRYIPRVLVRMRVGGASNRSLRNIILKSREDFRALRATRAGALGGFGALAWKNLSKLNQFVHARSARRLTD